MSPDPELDECLLPPLSNDELKPLLQDLARGASESILDRLDYRYQHLGIEAGYATALEQDLVPMWFPWRDNMHTGEVFSQERRVEVFLDWLSAELWEVDKIRRSGHPRVKKCLLAAAICRMYGDYQAMGIVTLG